MMRPVLCTLFDSRYLDKGILLYQSLEKCCPEFRLYVLAMDDRCYDVLNDLGYHFLIPIRLSSFENEQLLIAKANRSFGEYCWTCSSSLIQYVLHRFNEPFCAYVDADMYFYKDPAVLFDELGAENKSVLIVGHRFNRFSKINENIIGRYCVEFNLFKNEKNALSLLQTWINQCLECCSKRFDGIHYGDQKYLDNWVENYPFVMETQNMGAGIAPWNIRQYKLKSITDRRVFLRFSSQIVELVFYHFENISFLSSDLVNIHVFNSWGIDSSLVKYLYNDYLTQIKSTQEYLAKEFDIEFGVFSHPEIISDFNYSARLKNMIYRLKQKGGLLYILFNRIPSLLQKKKNLFNLASK